MSHRAACGEGSTQEECPHKEAEYSDISPHHPPHIAEVVSDVFGSSKYSPLVPQTPEVENGAAGKNAAKGTNGAKSNSSMGQEALLALLEARVTDLCAQLDTINPELRDSIFMNCEQARSARLKEEKRQETEMRRAERKQRHLERALADPPPKPL
nr:uncharacterized protein LOC113814331 [Penaeus vannamei]